MGLICCALFGRTPSDFTAISFIIISMGRKKPAAESFDSATGPFYFCSGGGSNLYPLWGTVRIGLPGPIFRRNWLVMVRNSGWVRWSGRPRHWNCLRRWISKPEKERVFSRLRKQRYGIRTAKNNKIGGVQATSGKRVNPPAAIARTTTPAARLLRR